MCFHTVVLDIARTVPTRSTPLLTLVALACGDGATEPKIPFPAPDLTGTWRIVFSAPGAVLVDAMSNDDAISVNYTGFVDVRIVQAEGNVSGEYMADGEVVSVDRHNVTTILPIVSAAGQLLNGQFSWDIQEICGPTRAWCMSGELFGRGKNTPGAMRATVSQVHVRSPTQIDVGVFRFYVDGLVDSASTHQFNVSGTASRVQ